MHGEIKRHGFRLGAVICDTLAASFAIENENDDSKAAWVLRSLNAPKKVQVTLRIDSAALAAFKATGKGWH